MGKAEFGARRYASRVAARPLGGTGHRPQPRYFGLVRRGRHRPRLRAATAAHGPQRTRGPAREASPATPVSGPQSPASTAGDPPPDCGVSVVDHGRAIRYHARTRSRGGTRFRIAPGQRVLVPLGVSPRGDKSRVQLSPGGYKTTSVCAPGRQSADCVHGDGRRFVHWGDIRGGWWSRAPRGSRGGEKSPPGDNDTPKVQWGDTKVQQGDNRVCCRCLALLILRSGPPR